VNSSIKKLVLKSPQIISSIEVLDTELGFQII